MSNTEGHTVGGNGGRIRIELVMCRSVPKDMVDVEFHSLPWIAQYELIDQYLGYHKLTP